MADGEAHEVGDVVDLEFGHDAAAVRIDAPRPDAEHLRDLFAGPAVDDELQHLVLPRAQHCKRIGFRILFQTWRQG